MMSDTLHTPEPWEILGPFEADEHDPYDHFVVCRRHAGGLEEIARVADLSTRPAKPIARLIAAAPELLEALIAIVRECDNGTHDAGTVGMQFARAAIEKVTE